MKKFAHNFLAFSLYLSTAGVISFASMPLLGNLLRYVFEPTGLWGSIWFIIPVMLVLTAVCGAWTILVCKTYFRFMQWCGKYKWLKWVKVQY